MNSHLQHRINAGLVSLILAYLVCEADAQDWHPVVAPLTTRWVKDVSPTNTLPEYPRPQMVREKWQNLNGLWQYGTTKPEDASPANFAGQILVPFCYESALSGVGKPSIPDQRLWYRRTFKIPANWKGERVLLHFGAVNWDSTVTVNGTAMGGHKGGYDAFTYDVTDYLKPGQNELLVSAWNPLRMDGLESQVMGKQRLHSEGYAYTAATGIWQDVWLEPVSATHIENLKITPDIDEQTLHLTVQNTGKIGAKVHVVAVDGKTVVAKADVAAGTDITLPIANPHLWTPDDPHLYDLQVTLTEDGKPIDSVGSYFGMRKISLGKDDNGHTRIYLNNKCFLQIGALDQGYWPDGIYTAPTDSALSYDIEAAKTLGFNLLRKHAKVESARWYYWADKLGMLVWQDMPQAWGKNFSEAGKAQWLTEWKREIDGLFNHPSIVVWTTFNEGWGQHDTEAIVAITKQLDPTRLVNNASGFTDKGVGDINDMHAYPNPGSPKPEANRAVVNGEFGGITMLVDGHRWDNSYVGYGGLIKDSWHLDRRYQELLKAAYSLSESQGTSAFVYTQITDVEEESNGLLTYDRAVIKPDVAVIAAANKGRFAPLPPNPNPDMSLVPSSEEDGRTWQYTVNKPDDGWMKPAFDASDWKSSQGAFGQGTGSPRTEWRTSDIWLRREVELPAKLPAKMDFDVFHDEDVEIYLNGVLAATDNGFVTEYRKIPINAEGRAALKPGKNLIAVHCHQTVGGQYIDVGIAEVLQAEK